MLFRAFDLVFAPVSGLVDADDKILLFQKGNVPDKIFHYVYGDAFDSSIYYVNAVSDAAIATARAEAIIFFFVIIFINPPILILELTSWHF